MLSTTSHCAPSLRSKTTESKPASSFLGLSLSLRLSVRFSFLSFPSSRGYNEILGNAPGAEHVAERSGEVKQSFLNTTLSRSL